MRDDPMTDWLITVLAWAVLAWLPIGAFGALIVSHVRRWRLERDVALQCRRIQQRQRWAETREEVHRRVAEWKAQTGDHRAKMFRERMRDIRLRNEDK